jgi:hypothetical protein
MKQQKKISSIVLIAWFLFLMIFLSAWNADRFVGMMQQDLKGINPENAKLRTDSWDSVFTGYFRFKEQLTEISGATYLTLNKRAVDNYAFIKDGNGNMQILEEWYDREHAQAQITMLADGFEGRGIPFVFLSMPPRFDKEEFQIALERDFFGQRDDRNIEVLTSYMINVLDSGVELADEGKASLYPFKTDIHLQTEGEIETARLLADKLSEFGVEIKDRDIIFDRDNYTVVSRYFAGNLVVNVGTGFTDGSDVFELWYPDFETDLTVESPGEEILKTGPFAESVMNGMDNPERLARDKNPYWVLDYLQFPSPYYTIENNLQKDGPRLLCIIDSYAMRTIAYLSLGAGHITVIDPRQEGGMSHLIAAMESGEYDAAVIAAGGRDFYNSLDLGF